MHRRPDIGDVNKPLAAASSATARRAVGSPVSVPQSIGECSADTPRVRHGAEVLAVIELQVADTRRRTAACAFSSIASNTGARLPGEALITCNTSAVAVCCSSASRCSVISRAFSIAITA